MSFVLRTERLEISPLAEADLGAFVAYRRDPDVARYQSWLLDYSLADARSLLAAQPGTTLPGPGAWLQLALRPLRTSLGSALIGDVAIGTDPVQPDTYELGVTLAPAHQGQGFAREALTGRCWMPSWARTAPTVSSCRRMLGTPLFCASCAIWGSATRVRCSKEAGSRGSGALSSASRCSPASGGRRRPSTLA